MSTEPAALPGPNNPQRCQVTDLLRLLGKAHVMGILYIFHTEPGPRRFVELQERLKMSPNTLSERLKELVGAGILTRTAYNEIPPRVDYAITTKGRELTEIFRALVTWANHHALAPEPPPGAAA